MSAENKNNSAISGYRFLTSNIYPYSTPITPEIGFVYEIGGENSKTNLIKKDGLEIFKKPQMDILNIRTISNDDIELYSEIGFDYIPRIHSEDDCIRAEICNPNPMSLVKKLSFTILKNGDLLIEEAHTRIPKEKIIINSIDNLFNGDYPEISKLIKNVENEAFKLFREQNEVQNPDPTALTEERIDKLLQSGRPTDRRLLSKIITIDSFPGGMMDYVDFDIESNTYGFFSLTAYKLDLLEKSRKAFEEIKLEAQAFIIRAFYSLSPDKKIVSAIENTAMDFIDTVYSKDLLNQPHETAVDELKNIGNALAALTRQAANQEKNSKDRF